MPRPPADPPAPAPAQVYQENLLGQAADAWRERDLDRLAGLLAERRDGASAGQRARFATFDALLRGALVAARGFAVHGFTCAPRAPAAPAADAGRVPPDLEMDEEVPLRVLLRPAAGRSYEILARGAGGSRTTLLVTMSIEDWLVDGSRTGSSEPFRHELDRDVEISASRPFELDLPDIEAPVARVKIRRVRLRGAFLFAGFEEDGAAIPLSRLDLEPYELVRFPKGFRRVREKPLATLRNALLRPADYLTHVLVAAWFLGRDGSPAERREATHRLIELLRSGPASCEKTARASLLWMVGTKRAPPQRDREGWLRWWALREAGRPAPPGAGR